jgi:hypothetical protein
VRKRVLLWMMLLVALAGVVSCSVLQQTMPSLGIGCLHAKYEKIQIGMRKEDVEAILGPPSSIWSGGFCGGWPGSDGTAYIHFHDGRVDHKQWQPREN